jgi:hypothetical protein
VVATETSAVREVAAQLAQADRSFQRLKRMQAAFPREEFALPDVTRKHA